MLVYAGSNLRDQMGNLGPIHKATLDPPSGACANVAQGGARHAPCWRVWTDGRERPVHVHAGSDQGHQRLGRPRLPEMEIAKFSGENMCHTTRRLGLLIALCLSAPLPAADVDCSQGRPKDACTIEVDAQIRLVPRPATVSSGTAVTIQVVNKPPLDSVKFTMDRVAATPPENPLSDLLT